MPSGTRAFPFDRPVSLSIWKNSNNAQVARPTLDQCSLGAFPDPSQTAQAAVI